MKILINIYHPAHVHFFKNFCWQMTNRGHEVRITAYNKDVTLKLLDAYGFEYDVCGNQGQNSFALINKLINMERGVYRTGSRFKPDIILGIGDIAGPHISKIIKAKSIVFTDTEHAKYGNLLSFPFADAVCTPVSFKKKVGNKQIKYEGYQALAYLHPNYFKPDPTVLDELCVKNDEKYVIVRFVSWKASHDAGRHGFTRKRDFVEKIGRYAKVFISSEDDLEAGLLKYKLTMAPQRLHSALYYASLCFGDGGTTAIESAVLGTPTVHFEYATSKNGNYSAAQDFGVFDELVNKYGLIKTFSNEDEAINEALEIETDTNSKPEWKSRSNRMLKDMVDVTSFMVSLTEGYDTTRNK